MYNKIMEKLIKKEKNFFDTIIIGGGASGIMCALNIKDKKTLLIEKDDKIGKKILVTGNGRCNFTNKILSTEFYNNKNIKRYFDKFNNNDTIKYFKNLGLESYLDEEGRAYPISNHASSVLDSLRYSLDKKKNVEIKTNQKALKIELIENQYVIKTESDTFVSKNLIICMGGNFQNIFHFKLNYTPFSPCLCGLKTEKNKGLNGIKQKNVLIKLIQNKNEYCENGEVLFKDNGISGICIFNLSNFYNENKPADLLLDLLKDHLEEELLKNLTNRTKKFEKVNELLTGMFHKQLSLNILGKSKVDINKKSAMLTNEEILRICKTIKNYKLKVLGKENNNQIYKGGISLNDLKETLEHKTYNNLYFSGEACDINAICGGYNLQWAWTSGKIIADAINNKK